LLSPLAWEDADLDSFDKDSADKLILDAADISSNGLSQFIGLLLFTTGASALIISTISTFIDLLLANCSNVVTTWENVGRACGFECQHCSIIVLNSAGVSLGITGLSPSKIFFF